MRSLSIASTGMLAQQLNVETISNNIANMNTTAFKRQRAEFQDLLYQSQRRVGASSSDNNTIVPAGVQVGLGVKAAAVYRITEQGNLLKTDNTLDVAIQGKGFFQVKQPDGTSKTVAISESLLGEGPESMNDPKLVRTQTAYAFTFSTPLTESACGAAMQSHGIQRSSADRANAGQVDVPNRQGCIPVKRGSAMLEIDDGK